jgi:pyrroline-5-carboxylate reductase
MIEAWRILTVERSIAAIKGPVDSANSIAAAAARASSSEAQIILPTNSPSAVAESCRRINPGCNFNHVVVSLAASVTCALVTPGAARKVTSSRVCTGADMMVDSSTIGMRDDLSDTNCWPYGHGEMEGGQETRVTAAISISTPKM